MAKQVIVMRKELKMKKGKLIAQGGHGPLDIFLRMMNNGVSLKDETPEIKNGKYTLSMEVEVGSEIDNWLRGISRKIALAVHSEEELIEIYKRAVEKGLPAKIVEDLGLTVFNGVKTKTAVVIGPDNDEVIDEITGHLPLY